MSTYLNKTYDADNYSKYRPTYPSSIFEHIVAYHRAHSKDQRIDSIAELACGTGQATKELAKHGKRVVALDYSEAMAKQAAKELQHLPNVECGVGADSDLDHKFESSSIDLVAVAEAAHYFSWPSFWDRAAYVLKPGGTLAIWSYWTFSFPEYPEVAKIIDDYAYSEDKCGPFWGEGGQLLINEYRDLLPTIPSDKFGDIEYRVNHFDALHPEEPFELTKKGLTVGDMIKLLKTWAHYYKFKELYPEKPDIADAVLTKITETTGLKPEDEVLVKWNSVYILATRK